MSSPASRGKYSSNQLGEHLKLGFDTYFRDWKPWLMPALAAVAIGMVSYLCCLLPLALVYGPLTCGLYACAFRSLKGAPFDTDTMRRGWDVLESAMAVGLVIFLGQVAPILILYVFIFAGSFGLGFMGQAGGGPPDPALVGAMVIGIIVFVALLLAAIAWMYYFNTKTMFALPLVADRGLDYRSALRESWNGTQEGFWWLLLLHFVGMVILNFGANLCIVGVLATLPIYLLMVAAAYDDRFGIQSLHALPPAPPPSHDRPPESLPPAAPRETGNPYQSS